MEAWPFEEAFLVRPLGSLVFALLLPLVLDWVVRQLMTDPAAQETARQPTRATALALSWCLGATAVGPALAAARGGLMTLAGAVACAAATMAVDTWLRSRWPAATRKKPLAAGFALAALLTGMGLDLGFLPAALLLLVAGLFAFPPDRGRTAGSASVGTWIGGAVACLVVALCALPFPLTKIEQEEAMHAGDTTWRLRVDPWDGTAMLAAGWAARRREDLDRADASAVAALRMGVGRGAALELQAEVLAARGECERARATFDEALEARAREAFNDDELLWEPLVLGGYQLPPTLVTECGGLETLPDLGSLRRANGRSKRP